MKRLLILALIIFSSLFTACGTPPAVVPTNTSRVYTEATALLTSTPDLCAPGNLETSIKAVNDLMREFDDSSQLASNLSKEQVPDSISEMQRIRRAAED